MGELGAAAAVTYDGLPVSSGGARAYAISFPADRVFPRVEPPRGLRDQVKRRFGRSGEIPEGRIGDALDFLDEIGPQPTNRYGMASVWVTMRCQLRLVDPGTGRPVSGQGPQRFGSVEYGRSVPLGTSGLLLSLHNQAALAVDFCITDPTDDLLRRLVPWLAANLPFKFSPKHWRVWTPTKTGSFRGKRLEPFW